MTAPAPAGPRPVQQVSIRIDHELANTFRRIAGTAYGAQRAALEEAMKLYIEQKTGKRPE